MFKKVKSVLNRKEKRIVKLESEVEKLRFKLNLLIVKLDRLEEDNKTTNKPSKDKLATDQFIKKI